MKKCVLATILSLTLIIVVLMGCGNTGSSAGLPTTESSETPSLSHTDESEASTQVEQPMNNNTLITNGGAEIALSTLEHLTDSEDAPAVYYLSDITPEAMVEIYNALEWSPTGKVAVKLSTGEPPASNYLHPKLIADLVQLVDGTIVECNTAYGGSRASTAMHYQVAEDHGFTDIAEVQILDEDGSMTLPVESGTVLSENYVGAAFADYDSYLVLSHFKGHAMAGFGGAIKNISIGLGSAEGKSWFHSGECKNNSRNWWRIDMGGVLVQLTETISARLSDKQRMMVAIDGRCAAGKTTLAAHLQEQMDCAVFHMERILQRNAQTGAEIFHKYWISLEKWCFSTYQIEKHCDLCINTSQQ